jgi:hypothetical protein
VKSRYAALGDGRLATVSWIATGVIAAFLGLGQLGAMVSLMMGGAAFGYVAPFALMAALSLGYWLAVREGLTKGMRWWPLALVLGLLGLALALSAFYYDLSWDGEWYHQTAILALARGWNPLADPMHLFAGSLKLWVRHYAKGPWYMAAAIYTTTGRIELGKCIDWLALAAAFLAVLAAGLDGGLRRSRAMGIAAIVAINPVVMSEVTTYLVDGVMVSFLVVAVASAYSGLRRPGLAIVVTGVAASIVAINAKFTGLVFLCFVFAAAGLWCFVWQWKQLLPLIGWAVAVILLGAGVWGFNPYVTNTLRVQQPFYPVLGSAKYPSLTQQGKEGIELGETPKNMMGRSRLVRFGYAIFGRPGNQPYQKGRNASLMWPFTARPGDLYAYKYHETRVAGFGPFFSGCLLLSLALGIWLLIPRSPLRWALLLPAGAIIASLLISVHLWWPRYGPQLWLLPIVPVVLAFGAGRSRWQVGAGWALWALLLANASIVAGVRLHWETTASLTLRRQLQELRESGKEYEFYTGVFGEAVKVRLAEAGVRFRDLGSKTFPDGHELMSVVEGYPRATRYRLVVEPDPAAPGTTKAGQQ